MKFYQAFILTAIIAFGFTTLSAQITQIDLAQTTGEFATTNVDLAEGQYQFNIINDNVGTDVGFVLVPEGKYDPTHHIKSAYVTAPVANNDSGLTGVVNLEPGVYEYFCPLNNTPKYTINVKGDVQKVGLDQMSGDFKQKSVSVKSGDVQFEIANLDVDHPVGFVLVPKGQYDQSNHISAAYVTAPVAQGKTSLTGIVNLEPGVYEYFCPLNPTPKYTLTVSE